VEAGLAEDAGAIRFDRQAVLVEIFAAEVSNQVEEVCLVALKAVSLGVGQ